MFEVADFQEEAIVHYSNLVNFPYLLKILNLVISYVCSQSLNLSSIMTSLPHSARIV